MRRLWTVRLLKDRPFIFGKKIICLLSPLILAVMGFSAGGILCGDLLLNFDGLVNGTTLDPSYVPDELDNVLADACAVGMIYSFYGRLSVASTDVEKFKSADLPPTYFLYGTEDPFYSQFGLCADATREAGIETVEIVLQDTPHGFGYQGNWIPDYVEWLDGIMKNN